jgi:hypothetical protein
MYKVHIKRWGVGKNISASNVETILRSSGNLMTADPPTILIGGRPVDNKRLERYLRRTKKSSVHQREPFLGGNANLLSSTSAIELSKLSSYQLISPDDLRLPEHIMLLCKQLVVGSRDNGIWAPEDNSKLNFATDTLIKWDHDIGEGILLFNNRKYKHAFKVLDHTFGSLGQRILNYEPALLTYVLANALWSHVDIGQRLLSYAAEMSKTKLAANHPMSLIWDRLSRMGIQQIKRCAWPIFLSYINNLEEVFGTFKADLLFVYYWLCNDAYFSGTLTGDDCTRLLQSIIEEAELLGQRTHALQAKSVLVGILISEKRYCEAKKVRQEVDDANHRDGNTYNKQIEDDSLRHHFSMCRSIGTVEESVQAGRNYLQHCQNCNGRDSSESLWVASLLKKYMDDVGYTDDVERLQESLNPDWDAFCQRIEYSS